MHDKSFFVVMLVLRIKVMLVGRWMCVGPRCFNLSEQTFSNSPLSYTDGGHTALPNPQQREVYFAEFAFVYLLKFDTTPFE